MSSYLNDMIENLESTNKEATPYVWGLGRAAFTVENCRGMAPLRNSKLSSNGSGPGDRPR